MAKFNILLLFTVMTSMLLCSCEEEYVILNKDFQSKIVLNSIFSPDNTWKVNLKSNRNIHDSNTSILEIVSADVVIYNGDGSLHGYLEYDGSGNYINPDLFPVVDHAYKIEVNADGFEQVTAISCVPNKAQIELEQTSVVSVDGVTSVQVNFNIIDQDDSRNNFYIWEVITRKVNSQGVYITSDETDEVFSTLLSLDEMSDDISNGAYQNKLFITDESFQGGSHSTSFLTAYHPQYVSYSSIDNSSDPSSGTEPGDEGGDGGTGDDGGTSDEGEIQDQVFLKVTTVSEELYNHYKSLETYIQKLSNPSSGGKPIEIYSNVINGLGIFGGFSEVIIEI